MLRKFLRDFLKLSAIGIVLFSGTALLCGYFLHGKIRDLTLFAVSFSILPILTACLFLMHDRLCLSHAEQINVAAAPRRDVIALCLFLFFVPVLFFDFSFVVEPLHYMTNIGPALHLTSGGRLLVDTFSQYGPGPVLLTWMSFLIGPASFQTANTLVQFSNLAYFALFGIFLFAVCRKKWMALSLCLLSISFVLSAWGHGEGNINLAPSSFGMRYLPTLCMVLAIAALKPPTRHSAVTVLATAVSTLWSAETLVGTLSVHLGFLLFLNARFFQGKLFIRDGLIALLPAVLVVGAGYVIAWLVWSTELKLGIYLEFFRVYNPLSDYWAQSAPPSFWWWAPILLAPFLAFTYGWAMAFSRQPGTEFDLFVYRMIPMAILCVWSAVYFVGRSVDYTLLLAFMPFSALVICACLDLVDRGESKWLYIPIAGAAFYAAAFVTIHFLRPNGPYVTLLHECRDHRRCSLASLAGNLDKKWAARPVLERVGDTWSDRRFESQNILHEAVRLTNQYAKPSARVTMLLGRIQRSSYLSDVALMYANRWHTWPRSFTFTDELVPTLVQNILNANVVLHSGSLVIVRRDSGMLDKIEGGIWSIVRNRYRLCELQTHSDELTAYLVSSTSQCG